MRHHVRFYHDKRDMLHMHDMFIDISNASNDHIDMIWNWHDVRWTHLGFAMQGGVVRYRHDSSTETWGWGLVT